VADSFFARREALPVYSPKRLDTPYTTLERGSQFYWQQGFNRDTLITYKGKAGVPAGKTLPEAETPRLLAVLLKAMEEEWEATSVSHETSRQLLFATGLLPRNVAVPEWAQFGMGSFFETPLQSPWGGTGAPNSYWLPRFQELRSKGKLEADPYATLLKVITDDYFRQAARRSASPADLRKARAAAWSLTYFLAQQELVGLQAYFKELSKMPRDIALDDKVLIACFARAMNCTTTDPATNRLVIREPALRALAQRWINYTNAIQLESDSIHQEIRKAYAQMSPAAPAAPAQNNGPGAGPGNVGPRPGGTGTRPKGGSGVPRYR